MGGGDFVFGRGEEEQWLATPGARELDPKLQAFLHFEGARSLNKT